MAELAKVDLVGVGLNATDTLIPLAHFPARGSKVEYANASILPGGQAATTVIACQTWGLTTRYVGKLGDDEAANLHRREFARAGVDARLITVPNAAQPAVAHPCRRRRGTHCPLPPRRAPAAPTLRP